MLYWSGRTEELRTYKFPGCGEICPLDKFEDIVKDVLPSEEEANHKWDHFSKEDFKKMYEETINVN